MPPKKAGKKSAPAQGKKAATQAAAPSSSTAEPDECTRALAEHVAEGRADAIAEALRSGNYSPKRHDEAYLAAAAAGDAKVRTALLLLALLLLLRLPRLLLARRAGGRPGPLPHARPQRRAQILAVLADRA